MSYDPHDENDVAAEADWRAGREQWRKDAWSFVLHDARGRAVIAEILATSGYYAPSFTVGQPDMTAYLEGRRSVGLGLHAQINLNSAEYLPDIEARLREIVRDVGNGNGSSD